MAKQLIVDDWFIAIQESVLQKDMDSRNLFNSLDFGVNSGRVETSLWSPTESWRKKKDPDKINYGKKIYGKTRVNLLQPPDCPGKIIIENYGPFQELWGKKSV